MSKKYTIPGDDEQKIASEPIAQRGVVNNPAPHVMVHYETSREEPSFATNDAPCQYTIEELQEVIRQSLTDKSNGKVHTHEEVQQMVFDKIQSWR